MPRPELEELQLRRLRAARRRRLAGRLARAALHAQGRPARRLPARPRPGAAHAAAAAVRILRDDGQADRRRLHAGRSRRVRAGRRARSRRGRSRAWHDAPQRLRVRPLHRRARLPRRRRAPGAGGRPRLGRDDRAAADPDPRPGARRARLHAELRAHAGAGVRGARRRAGRDQPDDRHARRGAVDGGDAPRDRRRARRARRERVRPLRDHRPGSSRRVLGGAGRAAPERGPLPAGGRRSGKRRSAPRRPGRCFGHNDSNEGSAPARPLLDGGHHRPRPQPVQLRPYVRPDGGAGRPDRRHAHHPRRQRVPEPGRGHPARAPRADSELPDRRRAGGHAGHGRVEIETAQASDELRERAERLPARDRSAARSPSSSSRRVRCRVPKAGSFSGWTTDDEAVHVHARRARSRARLAGEGRR